MDAAPTWKLLDELLSWGYKKAHLAKLLGKKTPALQFKRTWVTANNAAKVRELHDKLLRGRAPEPADEEYF
jgi:hypothetical protein